MVIVGSLRSAGRTTCGKIRLTRRDWRNLRHTRALEGAVTVVDTATNAAQLRKIEIHAGSVPQPAIVVGVQAMLGECPASCCR